MKDKNIIIFDSHAICHRIKHSFGYLSTEVEYTGIIFGYLKQIKKFAELYNTNRFIFAWDSKSSKRRELFPGYRLHDLKEISEEEKKWHTDSYKQFTIIRKTVLPACGFYNSFQQKGYEADDIIASIVNSVDGKKIIVSSDEDLYQLLNDDTIIYDLKKKVEFNKECFSITFGIEPEQWGDIKAIGGCSSDKVPGCKGVGEKIALKYLKNELKKDSNKYRNIEKYLASEEFLCYNKIVRLPFEGTKTFDVDFDIEFNKNGFADICKRFRFNSFSVNEWDELFNG